MALGFFPILLIVIAGIVAVVSIVGCCCACICGTNPFCWLGVGLLAALGIAKPRQERQSLVIHHGPGPGVHYQDVTAVMPTAPPAPVVQGYRYEPVVPYATAVDPSAPPQNPKDDAARVYNQHEQDDDVDDGQPMPPSLWPDPPRHTGLRDAWAMWLFLLCLAVVIGLAVCYGLPMLGVLERGLVVKEGGEWDSAMITAARHLLLLCLGLAIIGDIFALAWLHLMLKESGVIIAIVLWGTAVVSIVLSLVSILLGVVHAFVVFGILSVWALCLLSHEGHRIHLASVNLRIACVAVGQSLGLIVVAYGAVLAQLVWTLIWTLAAVGVYGEVHRDPSTAKYHAKHTGLILFMALTLYWGQQVIQNVLRCTVVGVIANWYFTPDLQSPIGPSLRRATSLSLGSICLGSLTVAIISTTRLAVQLLTSGLRWLLGTCVSWLIDAVLACVEAAFRSFNRWAFVFVGTWGYEFTTSSHMAVNLFEAKGVDITINDYVLSNVFWLGSLLIATITATLGVLSCNYYPDAFAPLLAPAVFAGVAGFFLGLTGGLILTDLLTSAVDTIFVCFWMDPMVLQTRRPQDYAELTRVYKEWEAFSAVVDREIGRQQSLRTTHIYYHGAPPPGSTTTIILPQPRQLSV